MITIVLVDDHYLMVSGLKMIISGQEDLQVVGTANDAISAIEAVKTKKPDVVVLDISLPGVSGLDMISQLKSVSPKSKILILTMYDDKQYLEKALEKGALGYLLKKAVEYDLIYSIRTVAGGELYIHPSLLKDFVNKEGDNKYHHDSLSGERSLWDSLSPREREILIFVAEGFSSKEIGEKLFINEKTVATHRLRGMEKLGFSNKSDLVDLIFFKLKLLEK